MLSQIPLNEDFGTDCQIKNSIRNKSDTVHVTNPGAFDSTDDCPRHQRVDVTIRQNNESRTQRWNNSILELVCEVGCIEQAQRSGSENIALHCLFHLTTDKHGSFQADVHGWRPAPFQPIAEHIDLC